MKYPSWIIRAAMLVCLACVAHLPAFAAPTTLAEFQAIYEEQSVKIEDEYKANIEAVNHRYKLLLDRQMEAAKKSGDFDGYKKTKATRETFDENRVLPPSFEDQLAIVNAAKAKAVIHLTKKYVGGLTRLKVNLMQKNDMITAEVVEQEVKRVTFIAADLESNLPATKIDQLEEGLVLHYDFDRNEYSKVTDKSDSGNDGKNNGASWVAFSDGRRGVMDFNGKVCYIAIGHDDIPDEWTASMWVKNDHRTKGPTRLLDSSQSSLRLEQGNSSETGFTRYRVRDYQCNYVVELKRWVCLTFVGDGTSTRLYANGLLRWKNMHFIPCPMSAFGHSRSSSFSGELDDVMVWNRALSESEVQQLYKKQVGTSSGVSTPATRQPPKLKRTMRLKGPTKW